MKKLDINYELKIKQMRNRRGLSQLEVSHRTGISLSTIQGIEKHWRDTKISVLVKILKVLDCKFEDLVKIL